MKCSIYQSEKPLPRFTQEKNRVQHLVVKVFSYFAHNELKLSMRYINHLIHIFLEWNVLIYIKISLKFVPKCQINNIPLFILRTVYFSMVHSHLNYGLFAWGFDSNRMIKLQKRCVRIKRSRYNAHTQPLMKQLNIRSVPDMLLLNSMKLYYKYKRNEVPHYFTSFNLHKAQLTTTTTARETTSGQIECASISLKNVFEIICRKR